jgi:hypothetical protein
MGCIYSSNVDGKCSLLWDDDKKESSYDSECIDKNGYCLVEEDPEPAYSCEDYQSDDPYEKCPECGEINENNYSVCEFCDYCFECNSKDCECEPEDFE